MKLMVFRNHLLLLTLTVLLGCTQSTTPPASKEVPSISAGFLTTVDLKTEPQEIRDFVKLASSTNIVGRPAADFTAAFAQFDDITPKDAIKDGFQQLFYFPPMSGSAKKQKADAQKNGDIGYLPIVSVQVVDGVIRDVQGFQQGF